MTVLDETIEEMSKRANVVQFSRFVSTIPVVTIVTTCCFRRSILQRYAVIVSFTRLADTARYFEAKSRDLIAHDANRVDSEMA